MSERVLSKRQSKILLALLDLSSTSSARILRITGISASSWNKEKRLLENTGLIVSWNVKDLMDRGILRKTKIQTCSAREACSPDVARNLFQLNDNMQTSILSPNFEPVALERAPMRTLPLGVQRLLALERH